MSQYDSVTGLLNRHSFNDKFTAAIANQEALAVLIVDLDRFNRINKTKAYEFADALLRLVAERLSQLVEIKSKDKAMNSDSPILVVKDVVAGYVAGVDILQGINLIVHTGELVTVIGANGAGKSTLAKMIFGLVPVRSGEVIFNGKKINGMLPNQIVGEGMGYVPQVANVFPSLSISENLDMGAYISDRNVQTQKQKIYDIFPALAKRQRQRAGTLSGGERQMLAMGRALMLSPQLLILDEPTAALSPILVQDVFNLIQYVNSLGTTIILVEQNARKALAIAQRGYVLDAGCDRFEGKGSDLLNDPKIGELYLGVGGFGGSNPD